MSGAMAHLLDELAGVARRIDNMEFLVRFQHEKRERIIGALREKLGRTHPRTRFIDFDARRNPRTDRSCIVCQQDLRSDRPAGEVRLITTRDAGPHAVHVEDIGLLDLGVLVPEPGDEDEGPRLIGLDCARRMGAGWWMPERPRAHGQVTGKEDGGSQ